jgi:hypothetical protein
VLDVLDRVVASVAFCTCVAINATLPQNAALFPLAVLLQVRFPTWCAALRRVRCTVPQLPLLALPLYFLQRARRCQVGTPAWKTRQITWHVVGVACIVLTVGPALAGLVAPGTVSQEAWAGLSRRPSHSPTDIAVAIADGPALRDSTNLTLTLNCRAEV